MLQARQAAPEQLGAVKAVGDGGSSGARGRGQVRPALQEEEAGPPLEKRVPQAAETEEDDSPLSQFKASNAGPAPMPSIRPRRQLCSPPTAALVAPPSLTLQDWQAVAALDGRGPASAALQPAAAHRPAPAKERIQAAQHPSTHMAADVASLVHTILAQAAASRGGKGSAAAAPAAAGSISAGVGAGSSLTDCLELLAEPSVLAAASDSTLAELLRSLQPLLRYSPATRRWVASGLAAALGPLQQTCQASMFAAGAAFWVLPASTHALAIPFHCLVLQLCFNCAVSYNCLASQLCHILCCCRSARQWHATPAWRQQPPPSTHVSFESLAAAWSPTACCRPLLPILTATAGS